MTHEPSDPREEIRRELEALIGLGLVTITGITDDGNWLYSLTDKAKEMSEQERWEAIFGSVFEVGDDYYDDL